MGLNAIFALCRRRLKMRDLKSLMCEDSQMVYLFVGLRDKCRKLANFTSFKNLNFEKKFKRDVGWTFRVTVAIYWRRSEGSLKLVKLDIYLFIFNQRYIYLC